LLSRGTCDVVGTPGVHVGPLAPAPPEAPEEPEVPPEPVAPLPVVPPLPVLAVAPDPVALLPAFAAEPPLPVAAPPPGSAFPTGGASIEAEQPATAVAAKSIRQLLLQITFTSRGRFVRRFWRRRTS
jgi:hypothetical protein